MAVKTSGKIHGNKIIDLVKSENLFSWEIYTAINKPINTENTHRAQVKYSWTNIDLIGTLQFGSKTAEYGPYDSILSFSGNTFEVYFEDSNSPRMLVSSGNFELINFTKDKFTAQFQLN